MNFTLLKNKKFWQASATLIGMIIGAGILGLPYVISKTGIIYGLLLLLALGLASMLINLMIAEIILRTRYRYQLAGLIKKYLGVKVKHLAAFSIAVGYYGALSAYIVGQGGVLASIFGQNFLTPFHYSMIFFAFGVVALFFGLKWIKRIDFWAVIFIVIVTLLISFYSWPKIDWQNFQHFEFVKIFGAYGVILFAFNGLGAVFSVREILRGQEKLVKPAIMVGSLIPMIVYALFAIIVFGVCGEMTTQVATIGLGQILGPKILMFGNLFAFLAMATSFVTVGLALKQMFRYDYKISPIYSWLMVICVPIFIFLFLSKDFIQIINIAGSLTFGITGILIILTFWRAKKNSDQPTPLILPKFKILGNLMIFMFILGIIYALFAR